jgi:hypothetical protein
MSNYNVKIMSALFGITIPPRPNNGGVFAVFKIFIKKVLTVSRYHDIIVSTGRHYTPSEIKGGKENVKNLGHRLSLARKLRMELHRRP